MKVKYLLPLLFVFALGLTACGGGLHPYDSTTQPAHANAQTGNHDNFIVAAGKSMKHGFGKVFSGFSSKDKQQQPIQQKEKNQRLGTFQAASNDQASRECHAEGDAIVCTNKASSTSVKVGAA